MLRVLVVVLILVFALTAVAQATSWGEIKRYFTPRDDGTGYPPPPPPPPPPDGLAYPGDALPLGEIVQIVAGVLLSALP